MGRRSRTWLVAEVKGGAGAFRAEVSVAFELTGRIKFAAEYGDFLMVLSGNCNTAPGTIFELGPEEMGVVWFDAHRSSTHRRRPAVPSRMGLATAVGYCWRATAQTVPGFRPAPEENVLLIEIQDASAPSRRRPESRVRRLRVRAL